MRIGMRTAAAAVMTAGLIAAGCGGSDPGSGSADTGSSTGAAASKGDPLANVDAMSLVPEGSFDTSQQGDKAVPASELAFTPEVIAKAKAAKLRVGIVMHSTQADWSTLQVNGMKKSLNEAGVEVVGVTDANWSVEKQMGHIDDMIQQKPDGIISIPVDTSSTIQGYKKIQAAGIKLVMVLQQPEPVKDFVFGRDFTSLIQNEGVKDGYAAGAMLSPYIPKGGTVLNVNFQPPFYTVDTREKGAADYWKKERPDVKVKTVEFADVNQVQQIVGDYITANPDVDGIFAVWDVVAMGAIAALREQGKTLPVTTEDVGTEDALDLAKGGMTKGIQAQSPYDQGVAEGQALVRALVGEKVGPYYTVPAVPALQNNILWAWKQLWKENPPKSLIDACTSSAPCAEGKANQEFLTGA
jgi:ribose transport system substrate-binding protein